MACVAAADTLARHPGVVARMDEHRGAVGRTVGAADPHDAGPILLPLCAWLGHPHGEHCDMRTIATGRDAIKVEP